MPDVQLRRPGVAVLIGWCGLALVVAVAALLLGGGAPEPSPPGLPDPGAASAWALRLVRLAAHAAVLVAAGGLLAALLADRPARRLVVAAGAAAWAVAALLEVLLGLSDVVGRPVHRVLDVELLGFFVRDVPQGRAALLTAVLAAAVAVAAALGRGDRRAGAAALLVAVLATTWPVVVTGHAASAGNHRLAQVAVAVHVAAAVLWVAGLAALVLLRRRPVAAVQRFSALALCCAVAVAASGVVSVVLRLGPQDLLTTGYGGLVVAKSAVLALVVGAGAQHRRHTLPLLAAGQPEAFRRLAVVEVGAMAAAFGLAVALARTPPPL